MDRVRPWLFVGRYLDSRDPDLLHRFRIKAMLHLADDVRLPGIISLYLPVDDGEPLPPSALQTGVEFVRSQKALDHRVLVACGAGISRSVSFAIAALKEEEGLSLVDAYHAVWQVHPEAMPHPALWQSLQAYYHEDTSFGAVFDLLRQWEQA